MTRRVDRGMLALLPPLLAYMAFGVARVDAPVGLIGLLFDEPLAFALTSTVIAIGGSVLLFVPAIERRLAGVLVPSREADVRQRARIEAALARVGARADMDTRRLIVQVQDTEGPERGRRRRAPPVRHQGRARALGRRIRSADRP